MGLLDAIFSIFGSSDEKKTTQNTIPENIPQNIAPAKQDNILKDSSFELEPHVSLEVTINRPEPEIPEYQGDYAKTIFLWAYQNSIILEDDDYNSYLLYECGIRNPSKYHKELIKDGYYTLGTFADQLSLWTVNELKPLLKQLGKPVSGKKADLVKRIVDNADESFLKKNCKSKIYTLSEKGKSFLADHKDYVDLHRNGDCGGGWQLFDKNKAKGFSLNDTRWQLLNQQVLEDKDRLGMFPYYQMSCILLEENKHEEALRLALKSLFLNLSGITARSCLGIGFSDEKAIELIDNGICIVTTVFKVLKKCADVYTDKIALEVYDNTEVPINLCDKQTYITIIHSVYDDTFDRDVAENLLRMSYHRHYDELFKAGANKDVY